MKRLVLVFACLFFLLPVGRVLAHDGEPHEPDPLVDVAFDQKLDSQLPLDLQFTDETGRQVRLGDYFNGKPVILTLAYYECPMLCNLALNDLTENLRQLRWNPGEQFELVTVSFDPGEGPGQAARKKELYVQAYGRPQAAQGWHFLTGSQAEIEQLTETVGFRYVYDAVRDEYAHPTGAILLTSQGKISRYIFGIDYSARDLRLGLAEASERKIATPVDQFFLLCYHYDPATGQYTPLIQNIVRIFGTGLALTLAGFIMLLFLKERNTGRSETFPGSPGVDQARR